MGDARRQRRLKDEQDRILSMELEMTFPASDPPASTQPGSGVTGARAPPRATVNSVDARNRAHRRLKLQDRAFNTPSSQAGGPSLHSDHPAAPASAAIAASFNPPMSQPAEPLV
jgi:hypothetical protein